MPKAYSEASGSKREHEMNIRSGFSRRKRKLGRMALRGSSKCGDEMGAGSIETVQPSAFHESMERGFPIPKDELAASLVPFSRHGAGF